MSEPAGGPSGRVPCYPPFSPGSCDWLKGRESFLLVCTPFSGEMVALVDGYW